MLAVLKHSLSIYLIIPIILLSGIYFSIELRFIQFRKIFDAVKYTIKTSNKQQTFSSLGALFAVLGGNLGTGNIAGIAVALTTGGPGSLFWMTIMVIFGSIIKFCCCFLGIKYRERDQQNNWVGGPMFYLSKGLNCTILNKIFCILVVCAAITAGNFIQVNSIVLPLYQANISPWVIIALIMLFISIVMFGEVKRFAYLVTSVVPVMALFYIGACIKILFSYKSALLPSISLIFDNACNYYSVQGAGLGFMLSEAIRVGFDRGIMATDTGIGIAPILHSKVSSNPKEDYKLVAMQQGLISMLAPVVVLAICLLTGMVLLVTGAWKLPLQSTQMCLAAFNFGLNSPTLAILVVNITLCFFAFTTILTWGYCAETAVNYLFNNKNIIILFKLIFIAFIPCGMLFEVKFLWNLADLVLNFMLLINMYGVCGLFNQIIQDMRGIDPIVNISKKRVNYVS